jgi:hypothetical protein
MTACKRFKRFLYTGLISTLFVLKVHAPKVQFRKALLVVQCDSFTEQKVPVCAHHLDVPTCFLAQRSTVAGTKSFCKARGRRGVAFPGSEWSVRLVEVRPSEPRACWLNHRRRAAVMHTARGTRACFVESDGGFGVSSRKAKRLLGSRQDKGRHRSEERVVSCVAWSTADDVMRCGVEWVIYRKSQENGWVVPRISPCVHRLARHVYLEVGNKKISSAACDAIWKEPYGSDRNRFVPWSRCTSLAQVDPPFSSCKRHVTTFEYWDWCTVCVVNNMLDN